MPLRLGAAVMMASLAVLPAQFNAGSKQQELVDMIVSFRESAAETAQARGPSAIAIYDDRKIAAALARARAEKDGDKATRILEEAYLYLEDALVRLRDKESVVYDRNFRNPADEYRYLASLYASYTQLIDLAAGRKGGLGEGERGWMGTARQQHAAAAAAAAKSDWPAAKANMDAASASLMRVLDSLGVMASQ